MKYRHYFFACLSIIAMSLEGMIVPSSAYYELDNTGKYYRPTSKDMLESSRQIFGNEPANAELYADLEDVTLQYKNKGFKVPVDSIELYYLNSRVQNEELKKGKKLAALTNGRNCIHIHPNFNAVPAEQRKQALAHEMAHIVLNNNTSLNPQYWSYIFPFAAVNGLVATGGAIATAHAYGKCKRVSRYGAVILSAIVGIGMLPESNLFLWRKREYDPNLPWGHSYEGTRKYEEMACDLLAAYTMKNGPEHGKKLFTTFMEANGDTNGRNGDHPWTSQRIRYHDMLMTVQDWIRKFSEKQ